MAGLFRKQVHHFVIGGCVRGVGQVLGKSEELVAVGKPPTVPVHASGQHRRNTLLACGGLMPGSSAASWQTSFRRPTYGC